MTEQVRSFCDHEAMVKRHRLAMIFGVAAMVMAIGFGYGMAAINYTQVMAGMVETQSRVINELDARHTAAMADKDSQLQLLIKALTNGEYTRNTK